MIPRRLLLPALLAAACGTPQDQDPPPDMSQRAPLAVLATSDFNSGALATLDLRGRAVQKGVDTIDAQAVVRAFGDKVYVIDQTHGVVRVYEPARGWKDPVEFSIEHPSVPAAQANPHDIWVDAAAQRAYVTLYGAFGSTKVTGANALGIVDLKDKPRLTEFIPLTVAAAASDGNPDADRLLGCGGALYVTLQDLDRNKMARPSGPARLAVVDLSRPAGAQYVQLAGQNPTTMVVPRGDCSQALIGHGDYQLGGMPSGKGGIERVDLPARKSAGLLMTDQELGGNVSALDAADLQRAFVDLVSKPGMDFQHDVYVVDLVARRRGDKVLGPFNFVPAVRVVDGQLLILSAAFPAMGQLKAGLYLGQADGKALIAEPLDTGLPPLAIDIY